MSILQIAARIANASGIKIHEFNWNPGDKRSAGSFKLDVETPIGRLVGTGVINSGSEQEDDVWTLNGQTIPIDVETPNLGIPHMYAGSKAVERFRKVMNTEIPETIAEWVEGYKSDPWVENEEADRKIVMDEIKNGFFD